MLASKKYQSWAWSKIPFINCAHCWDRVKNKGKVWLGNSRPICGLLSAVIWTDVYTLFWRLNNRKWWVINCFTDFTTCSTVDISFVVLVFVFSRELFAFPRSFYRLGTLHAVNNCAHKYQRKLNIIFVSLLINHAISENVKLVVFSYAVYAFNELTPLNQMSFSNV